MPRKKFKLRKKSVERIELLADFLIKFNLLAIPMYVLLFSGAEFYPMQLLLTDLVHWIITALGYEAVKNGIMLTLVSTPMIVTVMMGVDCTAWKSMYALAALMVASPVANDKKKVKYILLGVSFLFVLNIVRLATTVLVGYRLGMWYLDIMHTVLWREGMILAVVAFWLLWIKEQKVIFRKKQTILRKMMAQRWIFARKES